VKESYKPTLLILKFIGCPRNIYTSEICTFANLDSKAASAAGDLYPAVLLFFANFAPQNEI